MESTGERGEGRGGKVGGWRERVKCNNGNRDTGKKWDGGRWKVVGMECWGLERWQRSNGGWKKGEVVIWGLY